MPARAFREEADFAPTMVLSRYWGVFQEKEENQTEAQRSGFGLERRRKGAGEECPPGRSERKRTLRRRRSGA